MDHDRLQEALLVELLLDGPVGARREWAGLLVLRMLATSGVHDYRRDEDRLSGEANARAAIASLQAALAALTPAEQGLMLRALLLVPWEQVRRDTGLTLRLGEVLAALSTGAEALRCRAAAQAVVQHGEDALRQYPIEGLLPEVRQPGQGLVVTFDAGDLERFEVATTEMELDRLALAVQSFRRLSWESNLRPLVVWWLWILERGEAEHAISSLLADLANAARNDEARWRALGLLDWLAAQPDDPRASEALAIAQGATRSDVRKAATDLAGVLGRRDVLEAFVKGDPDRGVRERAAKLLTIGSGSGRTDRQGELFG